MRNQDTTDLKKIPAPVHAAIATLLLCVATAGYFHHIGFARFLAGTNDFLPRYTQARMVGTQQMYSIEAGYREQERIFAVSYTHLRAHETVLDLVCRLLLEKK